MRRSTHLLALLLVSVEYLRPGSVPESPQLRSCDWAGQALCWPGRLGSGLASPCLPTPTPTPQVSPLKGPEAWLF